MKKQETDSLLKKGNIIERIKIISDSHISALLIVMVIFAVLSAVYFLLVNPNIENDTFSIILSAVYSVITLFLLGAGFIGVKETIQTKADEDKTAKKCTVAIMVTIFVLGIGIAIGSFVLSDYMNSVGYRRGDFSEYTCADCDKPADGGKWKGDGQLSEDVYYCEEHFEENKKQFEEFRRKYDSYGYDSEEIKYIAKEAVLDKLKSPSTAKFSPSSETTVKQSDNEWIVKGWVESENSFGATLRNSYEVKITVNSEDWHTIDYCKFS